jgi:fumarate reductase flavoprotein subunit
MEGWDIDVDELIEQMYSLSEARAEKPLLRTWAENSGPVMDWIKSICEETETDFIVKDANHFTIGQVIPETSNNVGYYEAMTTYAQQFGAEVRVNSRAVQLVRPDDRVTGVIAQNADGSYTQYNANKAVVIASGGIGGDKEMMEKYANWAAGRPYEMTAYFTNPFGNSGDGVKMAMWAGAYVHPAPYCPMLHFNTTNRVGAKNHNQALGIELGNSARWLHVNRLGQRFADETIPFDFLANVVLLQPGETRWQIFSERDITDEPHRYYGTVREAVEEQLTTGEILKADTIEELAAQFGADPVKLKASIDRYNEIIEMGEDPDFGKPAAALEKAIPIDTPPYYACESPPNLLDCMGGLKITTDMQVLDSNWDVIPGLYAAGNTTGGFWGDIYPMGLMSAICGGQCMTFGHLAGKNAATQA